MTITAKQFHAYEKVRTSGKTNMFDVRTVSALSGLSRETIKAIMESYAELLELHGPKAKPPKS